MDMLSVEDAPAASVPASSAASAASAPPRTATTAGAAAAPAAAAGTARGLDPLDARPPDARAPASASVARAPLLRSCPRTADLCAHILGTYAVSAGFFALAAGANVIHSTRPWLFRALYIGFGVCWCCFAPVPVLAEMCRPSRPRRRRAHSDPAPASEESSGAVESDAEGPRSRVGVGEGAGELLPGSPLLHHAAASAARATATVPIVYAPEYNISAFGLERLHPFDSRKYARVYESLCRRGVIREGETVRPERASHALLSLVHSRGYLASLHSALVLTRILEVPVIPFLPALLTRWRVLVSMQYQVGGTAAAARLAMQHGWAINLGGGFHHASYSAGGGFCVYADITLAVKILRNEFAERVARVMIVDLDAHQGNGHERDFLGDRDVFIFDMYNADIFPLDFEARRAIAKPIELSFANSQDANYLALLRGALPACLDTFAPDVVVYNAGTDCMRGDPLGGLALSKDGIVARDEVVFGAALERRIPVVMVLSGGYQHSNAEVISSAIENLVSKFRLIDRSHAR